MVDSSFHTAELDASHELFLHGDEQDNQREYAAMQLVITCDAVTHAAMNRLLEYHLGKSG